MTMDPHAGGELTDDALQDEIELVGDLVVAASASTRALTDEEIDRVLGIKGAKGGHPGGHCQDAGERSAERSAERSGDRSGDRSRGRRRQEA
jgi:hypothetical protein